MVSTGVMRAGRAVSWVVAAAAAGAFGCGDDEPSSSADTTTTDSAPADSVSPDTDAATDSSAPDTTTTEISDTGGPGDGDGGGPVFTECEQACMDANPAGVPLFLAWLDCGDAQCRQFEQGTEAYDECQGASWTPGDLDAPCRDEADRCFSGTGTGCRELMDLGAQECEPDTLPMTEEQLFGAFICLVHIGWQAAPDVQDMAWPLLMCTFNDPPDGCLAECTAGAEGCRACAAQKCKPLYDACYAHTSGTPITLVTPAEEVKQCQDLFDCGLGCSPE